MCSPYLTLIPVRWHDGLGRLYVDSDKPQTGRNFGAPIVGSGERGSKDDCHALFYFYFNTE